MIRHSLIFLILICLFSCKHNSEVRDDVKNRKSEIEASVFNPLDERTKYVATSQGVLDGKLILNSKIAFATAMEYDSSKVLLNTKVTSGATELITHFNEDGKEIKMTNHKGKDRIIFQENKYNDHGDLLEEFRIEKNESSFDTTIYKYLYKYKRGSKDYTMIRTNNMDTVTHYEVSVNGKKEFKSELAHPNDRFYLRRDYETSVNENGSPIEILQTSIFKDEGDVNYDTTKSKTIYRYNEEGLVTAEINTNHGLKPDKVLSKYKNRMIVEKTIGHQVIKFNHLEIDAQ